MFTIYVSVIVAVMGAVTGLGASPPLSLSDRLFGAYLLFALFWGVPPVWRWWFRSGHGPIQIGGGTLLEGVFRFALAVGLFVFGAYCFSVLGGGLYCFLAHLSRNRRALAAAR